MGKLFQVLVPNLTESISSTAEKFLQVRAQRIVQELRSIALDAGAATSLVAPVGSPAMLVWRWYYLDNDDLLVVAKTGPVPSCPAPSARSILWHFDNATMKHNGNSQQIHDAI